MKHHLAFALVLLVGSAAWAQAPNYPDWAYAVPTPENEATAPKDDGTVFILPGSDSKFTRSQISGAGRKPPADWYPGDHPTMPALISTTGRSPCSSVTSPAGGPTSTVSSACT